MFFTAKSDFLVFPASCSRWIKLVQLVSFLQSLDEHSLRTACSKYQPFVLHWPYWSFGLEGCTGMSEHSLSSFWRSKLLFIGGRCMCEHEMCSLWMVLVVSFSISCSAHLKEYYTRNMRVPNNWHTSQEDCPRHRESSNIYHSGRFACFF